MNKLQSNNMENKDDKEIKQEQQEQQLVAKNDFDRSSVKLLLVGCTGSGKSSSGNSILNMSSVANSILGKSSSGNSILGKSSILIVTLEGIEEIEEKTIKIEGIEEIEEKTIKLLLVIEGKTIKPNYVKSEDANGEDMNNPGEFQEGHSSTWYKKIRNNQEWEVGIISDKAYLQYQELIRKNFTILTKEIDGGHLAGHLYKRKIINPREFEERKASILSVMSCMFQKPSSDWVPVFLDYLRDNYPSLHRVVMNTDVSLSKLQYRPLMEKLYQSGHSASYMAKILRENLRRSIPKLSREYVRIQEANVQDGRGDMPYMSVQQVQAVLIDLLGREDDNWVFPVLNYCKEHMGKNIQDIFG